MSAHRFARFVETVHSKYKDFLAKMDRLESKLRDIHPTMHEFSFDEEIRKLEVHYRGGKRVGVVLPDQRRVLGHREQDIALYLSYDDHLIERFILGSPHRYHGPNIEFRVTHWDLDYDTRRVAQWG
jgi:hypothetical protein